MNADFIEQWKRDAAAAIKEYARVHHPFKIKKQRGSRGYPQTQTVEEMYEEAQKILKNGGGFL